MKRRHSRASWLGTVLLVGGILSAFGQIRQSHPNDDFTVRTEMIPMRDGVKLHTLIMVPKVEGRFPILLERTPYNASRAASKETTRLEVLKGVQYLDGGYIFVAQDIRGRYRSEGDYAMYRVPRGTFNQSQTDESTDAWDTIEWLVHNVASNNGKVGVWGTSYPGWLTLAALREPHPALAAAVPFNPVVDVWKADDWFHWGAFRAPYSFEFIHDMESVKGSSTPVPFEIRDLYTWMLKMGSVGRGMGRYLDDRHEMWKRLMESPSYGPYWRDCAADRWFEAPSRIIPTLHVHGFFDQEDIYGSPSVYSVLERFDTANDTNFFAAGPWYHGQHWSDGSSLGRLDFDEDTAKRFREDILAPFLRHFLKGEQGPLPPPVSVFETGSNRWRQFSNWPPPGPVRRLYLQEGGALALGTSENESVPFSALNEAVPFTEFVSDPARPVPYAPRPHWGFDYSNPAAIAAWQRWLVEDQRFVDGRPDVAVWVSEPLEEPLSVRGPVAVKLFAETTGSDADWVVKLIDVFPDEHPLDLTLSGFEWMISADIFRGRYRANLDQPAPLQPNQALEYSWPLPQVNHTFGAGHRLMVQIQSTWFPLYDRNPQTFVPSIMTAQESAYQVQRHRIHHGESGRTYLEFRVDPKVR